MNSAFKGFDSGRLYSFEYQESNFESYLDIFVPQNGAVFLMEAISYFDESYSNNNTKITCVAGYIFEKKNGKKFDRDWRRSLTKENLKHFHMVDCAHGSDIFKKITLEKRIEIATRHIKLIKKYASIGLVATVYDSDWKQHLSQISHYPDPYTILAHSVLAGVRYWLESNPQISSKRYVFEAGHTTQTQANGIMKEIFAGPQRRRDYRYAGHSFETKDGNSGVQAADIIAWQSYKDLKNYTEGRPRRADLSSLLELRHMAVHHDPEKLKIMKNNVLHELANTGFPINKAMLKPQTY